MVTVYQTYINYTSVQAWNRSLAIIIKIKRLSHNATLSRHIICM